MIGRMLRSPAADFAYAIVRLLFSIAVVVASLITRIILIIVTGFIGLTMIFIVMRALRLSHRSLPK